MSLSFFKTKKFLIPALSLCLVLALGMGIGYLTNHVFSENARFEAFTDQIFREEVIGNTLTLHYSLANPEKAGIIRPAPTLGTISGDLTETYELCETYENTLKEFSYSRLSRDNQITMDMLLLYFHTLQEQKGKELLETVLSPSLGIQAQLPILLAEYAFYEDQDIIDYMKLLSEIRPYFQSILLFEQEKSKAGYFMSDTTLNRILEQCRAFTADPEENYMLEIFEEKLADYGKFSEPEQKKLIKAHRTILLNKVIPAYEELINGLNALRGTGKSSRGLVHFEGGREYYRYLIQSQTGTYEPVEKIEQRLSDQLMKDMKTISLMLKEQGSLASKLSGGTDLPEMEPEQIMTILQECIRKDFPALKNVSYEIRYVHDSMAEYLSPAFYLTPPLDQKNPNIIYINPADHSSGLNLFTTLAHEGFPGHLYQTVFFGKQNPCSIRYLLNCNGYVEGWATYIESYAYTYAADYLDDPAATDVVRLAWLNRSVNLCLYSLTDIGIHYHGWTQEKTAQFLGNFGISDSAAISEIFQYIVETPGNYLKYYLGYLNFLDLKTSQQKALGENFNLKEFHEQILKIGPVQFPVLKKYITASENAESKKESRTARFSASAGGSHPAVFLFFITPKKLLKFHQCSGERFCFLRI